MALSLGLRKRAVDCYENNEGTIQFLSQCFKIGTATLSGWTKQKRDTGTLVRKLASGRPRKIDEKGLKWLEKRLARDRDLTLSELARLYKAQFNKQVCYVTVHYTCERIKMNYKKNILSSRTSTTKAI
jgi:transposase